MCTVLQHTLRALCCNTLCALCCNTLYVHCATTHFMCTVQLATNCPTSNSEPLLKFLQGSWHSCSPLWGSRFGTRAQRPVVVSWLSSLPSNYRINKPPQLAPFKPNSLHVTDQLPSNDQPAHTDWHTVWGFDSLTNWNNKINNCKQQSPSAETDISASQEIPSIHGTGRFMTLLTQARHLSILWATSVQSKCCCTTHQNAEGDISQLTDRSVNNTAKQAANFITYQIQKTCSKLDEPRSVQNSQCVPSSHPLLFLPSYLFLAAFHSQTLTHLSTPVPATFRK
jgi:hypothetical protein